MDLAELKNCLETLVKLEGEPTKACAYEVGKCYLFRTITFSWTGKISKIIGDDIILENAAWIADLGRYHMATSFDNLSEVEYAGDGIILNRLSIVDARPWTNALPSETK